MTNPAPADLRAARAALKLTQQQAAELIGVTRVTWTRWELGTTPMPESQWRMFRHLAGIEVIPAGRLAVGTKKRRCRRCT